MKDHDIFSLTYKNYVDAVQAAINEERAACAALCDALAAEYDGFSAEQNASEKLAAAIRARGNK